MPAGAVLSLKCAETSKDMQYEQVLCLRSACHAVHLLHERISIQIQDLQTGKSVPVLEHVVERSYRRHLVDS
jgi:hypothetical protein